MSWIEPVWRKSYFCFISFGQDSPGRLAQGPQKSPLKFANDVSYVLAALHQIRLWPTSALRIGPTHAHILVAGGGEIHYCRTNNFN